MSMTLSDHYSSGLSLRTKQMFSIGIGWKCVALSLLFNLESWLVKNWDWSFIVFMPWHFPYFSFLYLWNSAAVFIIKGKKRKEIMWVSLFKNLHSFAWKSGFGNRTTSCKLPCFLGAHTLWWNEKSVWSTCIL